MRFFVISDNIDTCMGMRLAGMDGTVVHEREEVLDALHRAVDDPGIGIILMTEKLIRLCPEEIRSLKLNRRVPLVVEIPDRHGAGNIGSVLSQYVREAIGINIQ